ncbi:MAG: DNA-3-methyladenine glycosylase [Calditrichaeota bacterium]|nr:MAG: DNA-3-methyladenine glycosylase [Calditrichota bacterium]
MHPLPRAFYHRDTVTVAQELLGCYLVRRLGGELLIGRIVETEAYVGESDPACHAARGKTARNAVMYGPPGYAYVYFIYGMYYCLNAVTEREGFPAAVLIRALEPVAGLETMKRLRRTSRVENLTNGPGKLCQAMAIDRELNGADLCGSDLVVVPGNRIEATKILATPRIGIREGTEHLWRFLLAGNPWVSHARPSRKPQ